MTADERALWYAVTTGAVHGVRRLLERGVSPNSVTSNGRSILCEAAETASVDAVRLLLRNGASPHPLHDESLMEWFHSYQIPLFEAASGGSANCVRLLLAAGARPNQLDYVSENALAYASSAGAVEALSAAGCNPKPVFLSQILQRVADNGRTEVISALVRAGADLEIRDQFGRTPLCRICGSLETRAAVVRKLLDCGADPHARAYWGRTALHEAAELHSADRYGKLREIIEVLVAAGIDVDVTDDRGDTPLHAALGDEGVEMDAVQALLDLGADPCRKDHLGNTAIQLAGGWPGKLVVKPCPEAEKANRRRERLIKGRRTKS